MKIPLPPRSALRGNVLLVTLIVTGLAGLALVSYLTLVSQQTKVTARSQSYQACLAVAEAGMEDALGHLNKNGLGNPNLAAGEWRKDKTIYTVTRDFGNGYYKVMVGPDLLFDGNTSSLLPSCDQRNLDNPTLLRRDWFRRPCSGNR